MLIAGETQAPAEMTKAASFFDQYLSLAVEHTAAGAAFPYHWGANRHVGNMALLSLVHARNPALEGGYKARLMNYGAHQANYLLGDAGRSWIVGFGKDWPQYIHHKMASLMPLFSCWAARQSRG